MAKHKNLNPDDGGLFDDFDSNEVFEDKGPVTVLGLTFENDDERRSYFRSELRAKLPELRKIEGFPIGSDDDIINLSDPPYYTACPNPWLNDFIAEWEKEKKVLEDEGIRSTCVETNEPYAYGVKVGKNSAIYNAHTYHTKVPYELIMRYILHYTQPGDIIVDNFGGTGMCAVAASQCESPDFELKSSIIEDFNSNGLPKPNFGVRHAIVGDLSPLCFHISSNYNRSTNPHKLESIVSEILIELKNKFGDWYTIKINNQSFHINYFVWSQIVGCQNCGTELNVHDLSFNYETKELFSELTCPNCGMKQKKNKATVLWDTKYDVNADEPISSLKYECCLLNYSIPGSGRGISYSTSSVDLPKLSTFIPKDLVGDGYNKTQLSQTGCKRVYQIYPERTLHILSFLYNLINVKYHEYEKPLMFIFTSMLPKLTRLNRYMPQHGSRALVGPMANVLYLPPQFVENNPIDQFEYQANKIIKAFAQIKSGAATQIASATNSLLNDNSVDYIFTDPPFGANIMYSELNSITESWLKVKTNDSAEAISNSFQNKGYFEYQDLMTQSFQEYFRILKPGCWMTVEFSNSSAAFWNCLQHSITKAGFIVAAVTDLNKERSGLFGMIGPTAVKQDLALSCYKPVNEVNKQSSINSNIDLVDFVDQLLRHLPIHIIKDNVTTSIIERNPKILYDRVVSYYVQSGKDVPIDALAFQKLLKDHFVERDGMFFTASQVLIYDEKRARTEDFFAVSLFVGSEAEGIQWLKRELTIPKSYQDIQPEWMQALVTPKKGDKIPELKTILEENFIEDEDGRWRVPDPEKEADLEKIRNRRLAHEFKSIAEQALKPKSRIKDARLEALRYGFKEAYRTKDFETIVNVAQHLPEALVMEDEELLRYYDIASSRV